MTQRGPKGLQMNTCGAESQHKCVCELYVWNVRGGVGGGVVVCGGVWRGVEVV